MCKNPILGAESAVRTGEVAARMIEIVTASVDAYRPALINVLTPQEQARLERFLRPADRVRCAVGMALLRMVAGQRAGIDPRTVEIDRTCPECGGAHGKPRVADDHHYSVSHAGDLVVVAATSVGEIGVDIEPANRQIAAVPSSSTALGELRSWVRREAVVKAIGDGRAVESGDPIVEDASGAPALVHATGIDPASMSIIDLDLGSAYVAALAVRSTKLCLAVERSAQPLIDHWTKHQRTTPPDPEERCR